MTPEEQITASLAEVYLAAGEPVDDKAYWKFVRTMLEREHRLHRRVQALEETVAMLYRKTRKL